MRLQYRIHFFRSLSQHSYKYLQTPWGNLKIALHFHLLYELYVNEVLFFFSVFLWFSFRALFQHLNSDDMYSLMYWPWFWYSGVVLTNLLFLVLNMWFLFHYYYCYCNILILSKEFWREREREGE